MTRPEDSAAGVAGEETVDRLPPSRDEDDVHAAGPAGRVVLFHVPKTGGTSLAVALSTLFSPGETWRQAVSNDTETFREGLSAGRYRFIHGHLCPKKFISQFGDDWRKVVVLRNPLTHLPSMFFHWRNAGNHDVPSDSDLFAAAARMPLGEFLRSSEFQGSEDYRVLFDNPQVRFILGYAGKAVTAKHLRAAEAVLESCDVVSVMERLPEAIVMAAFSLGRPVPRLGPPLRANQALRPWDIRTASHDDIRAILGRTAFDDQLYRRAFQRHEERMRESVDGLSRTGRALAGGSPAADGGASVPPILLNDVFLNSPARECSNAEWGVEAMIIQGEIRLHPPVPDKGEGILAVDGVPLAGQTCVSAEVEVPDPNGPGVAFRITVRHQGAILAEARACTSAGGQRVQLSATVQPMWGAARIECATCVGEGWESNEYASALFRNAVIH